MFFPSGKKLILGFLVGAVLILSYLFLTTPSIKRLKPFKPSLATEIYSSDGVRIGEFSKERRFFAPMSSIPHKMIDAVVAAEDDQFFVHKGISYYGILRAMFKNLSSGSMKQGGSTITQQIAKSLFLNPDRNISRKIREFLLAYKLENALSKEELLEIYLNQIYFGSGAYGVAAAADTYFDKTLDQLTLSEIATLAGIIRAPSRDNPKASLVNATEKRDYVLNRMLHEKKISPEELNLAQQEIYTINSKPPLNERFAPYYIESVRKQLLQTYSNETLLTQGLRVVTFVQSKAALAAETSLKHGIEEVDRHQGYRGPLKHLNPQDYEGVRLELRGSNTSVTPGGVYKAVVTEVNDTNKRVWVDLGFTQGTLLFKNMTWARTPDPRKYWRYQTISKPSQALSKHDVIWVRALSQKREFELFQYPKVQGALLSMNPHDGSIQSMVGGYNFKQSEFNRALQARRQAGSVFKPIIYAAALAKGFTPATVLLDEPTSFKTVQAHPDWKPQNYEKKFKGNVLLRDSLIQSRNIPTINVLNAVGLDRTLELAKSFGVDSPLERNLSLALGASSVTPLEMAKVYAVFANGGNRVSATSLIKEVKDREGHTLVQFSSKQEPVFKPELAFIMTHLLQEVVSYGTGRAAQVPGHQVAGKTGTTDNNRDAWFVGYTPDLVTVVWLGFDDASKSLGEKEDGGKIASPIWSAYMTEALKDIPRSAFTPPSGVVLARVDRQTGMLSDEGVQEYFVSGTQPKENEADYLMPQEEDDSIATFDDTEPSTEEKVSLPKPEDSSGQLNQDFFLGE